MIHPIPIFHPILVGFRKGPPSYRNSSPTIGITGFCYIEKNHSQKCQVKTVTLTSKGTLLHKEMAATSSSSGNGGFGRESRVVLSSVGSLKNSNKEEVFLLEEFRGLFECVQIP
ncbi:hypothetical protein CEXT_291801 [Caerostris extrusa]|uniref:Uncharacterized protein n=1 Tax=Caerostris extrusa TaxID=172846 RepID=A0AAV4YEM4_CAEEX|nr:hypothetical protein CEXT_291801 [Caerostris extrusa]